MRGNLHARAIMFAVMVFYILAIRVHHNLQRQDMINCRANVNLYFFDYDFSGKYRIMQTDRHHGIIRISGHAIVGGQSHHVERSFSVIFQSVGENQKEVRLSVIKGSVISTDFLSYQTAVHTQSWATANVNDIENISRYIEVEALDKQSDIIIIKSSEKPVMICIRE